MCSKQSSQNSRLSIAIEEISAQSAASSRHGPTYRKCHRCLVNRSLRVRVQALVLVRGLAQPWDGRPMETNGQVRRPSGFW